MKHLVKRAWFYLTNPLGRKIYKDYIRLCRKNPCGIRNLSNDPSAYITYNDIQWSIAHRINILEEDAHKYPFLSYVPHGFYINNPRVSNSE